MRRNRQTFLKALSQLVNAALNCPVQLTSLSCLHVCPLLLQVLLLLDVDFMISNSLNEPQHTAWIHEMVSSGMLVVLPAFEPVHSDQAGQETVFKACTGRAPTTMLLRGCNVAGVYHRNKTC